MENILGYLVSAAAGCVLGVIFHASIASFAAKKAADVQAKAKAADAEMDAKVKAALTRVGVK